MGLKVRVSGELSSARPRTGSPMTDVNWRIIAFWAALWWFVYSAPTEDFFARALLTGSAAQNAEHMEGF